MAGYGIMTHLAMSTGMLAAIHPDLCLPSVEERAQFERDNHEILRIMGGTLEMLSLVHGRSENLDTDVLTIAGEPSGNDQIIATDGVIHRFRGIEYEFYARMRRVGNYYIHELCVDPTIRDSDIRPVVLMDSSWWTGVRLPAIPPQLYDDYINMLDVVLYSLDAKLNNESTV